MIKPIIDIQSKFNGELISHFRDSIFAFDFKDEVYWLGNGANINSKIIQANINKNSYINNKVTICPTLPIFAYVDKNGNSVIIIDSQQDKTINTITFNDAKVENVSISYSGDTILVGCNNGILSKWNTYNSKLLGMPNKHKDSVFFTKESNDGKYIVSVGYDKTIVLFDKDKDKNGKLIGIAPSIVRCGSFVADSTFLALGDTLGFIYIIDTSIRNIICKFRASFTQIINIDYYKDSYLFCLNDNGVLSIIDFNREEKVVDNFLSNNVYKQFHFNNDVLLLSTIDKNIIAYRLSDFLDYFDNLISEHKIAEAYSFVEINKFLETEQTYFKLNASFEADLLYCVALVCSNEREEALNILNFYSNIPSKSSLISGIINSIDRVNEFLQLMKNKIEDKAIMMAQKHSIIKKLKQYNEFEDRFSKLILIVKELVKRGRKDEAILLANPFRKIPFKFKIMQEVINFPSNVDAVINSIKSGDYASYIKMKRDFKFVDSIKEIVEFESSLKNYYFNLLHAFYSLDVNKCKKYIDILKHFKEYQEDVMLIEENLLDIEKLTENI